METRPLDRLIASQAELIAAIAARDLTQAEAAVDAARAAAHAMDDQCPHALSHAKLRHALHQLNVAEEGLRRMRRDRKGFTLAQVDDAKTRWTRLIRRSWP